MANAMVADIRHEDSPHAGHLYYIKVKGRCPPPYTTRRVEAIIDIADDGTLAGIELIGKMPPPPVDACKPYKAENT